MAETFFRTAEMLKPQIRKIFYKPQASDELKMKESFQIGHSKATQNKTQAAGESY